MTLLCFFFFFNQKTAYEIRISDWSSDVCSSDLPPANWSPNLAKARRKRKARRRNAAPIACPCALQTTDGPSSASSSRPDRPHTIDSERLTHQHPEQCTELPQRPNRDGWKKARHVKERRSAGEGHRWSGRVV